MEKRYFILLLFFCLLSCNDLFEGQTYTIKIQNESDNIIYTLCRYISYHRHNIVCLDSTHYNITQIIKKTNKGVIDTDRILKPTDTISIFILDKNEYEGKTWKQIVDSAKYKQIYHLSGDDIRRLDSKIPYPPSEVMRDMDMEPPYSEQKESD